MPTDQGAPDAIEAGARGSASLDKASSVGGEAHSGPTDGGGQEVVQLDEVRKQRHRVELALDNIARLINVHHRDVRRHVSGMLDSAVAAGDLLLQAKAKVKHGEWLPWLVRETKLKPGIAQIYMRLAKHKDEIRKKQRLRFFDSIQEGLKALTPPADVIEQVLRMSPGEGILAGHAKAAERAREALRLDYQIPSGEGGTVSIVVATPQEPEPTSKTVTVQIEHDEVLAAPVYASEPEPSPEPDVRTSLLDDVIRPLVDHETGLSFSSKRIAESIERGTDQLETAINRLRQLYAEPNAPPTDPRMLERLEAARAAIATLIGDMRRRMHESAR